MAEYTNYANVHPLLILGIIVFVIPFFNPVLHWSLPGWISGIGILLILLGAGLSIMKNI